MNYSIKILFVQILTYRVIYLLFSQAGKPGVSRCFRWWPTGVSKLSPTITNHLNVASGEAESLNAKMQDVSISHQLIALHEQERKQVAADLHDTAGQKLILLKNQVLQLKRHLPATSKAFNQAQSMTEIITDALQDIRNISYQLRPYELDLFGLKHAITSLTEQVAQENNWPLILSVDSLDNLFVRNHEIFIYRIWQDCLNIALQWPNPTQIKAAIYHYQGLTAWYLYLKTGATRSEVNKQTIDASLLRLQEHLNIVGGTIVIKEEISQVTTIQLLIPTFHEKA